MFVTLSQSKHVLVWGIVTLSPIAIGLSKRVLGDVSLRLAQTDMIRFVTPSLSKRAVTSPFFTPIKEIRPSALRE